MISSCFKNNLDLCQKFLFLPCFFLFLACYAPFCPEATLSNYVECMAHFPIVYVYMLSLTLIRLPLWHFDDNLKNYIGFQDELCSGIPLRQFYPSIIFKSLLAICVFSKLLNSLFSIRSPCSLSESHAPTHLLPKKQMLPIKWGFNHGKS